MQWRSTGARHQQLHIAVRAHLKAMFPDWRKSVVNFDALAADHVVRRGTVAAVTLPERIITLLPDMVNCSGGMVLAWPEEVESRVVFVNNDAIDIIDPPLLPTATIEATAA